MQPHADESARNLVTKRLLRFRHRLDEALKALPVEKTRELEANLRAMELGLGRRTRDTDLDQERVCELRIRRSPPERADRTQD